MGEAHPAAHPTLGDRLQETDQVSRGIGRRGFWQRRDPFPPTKPNGCSPAERPDDGLSISPVEDPDFAKQNDRDSAARPLTDIPIKLLRQGFNVPPRQSAAYGTGEDQLKSALMLSLHSSMVLLLGTRRGFRPMACWIRITLAITWPQGVLSEEDSLAVAAQVHGGVSWPVSLPGALVLHVEGLPHLSPHQHLASGFRSQLLQSPSFVAPGMLHTEALGTKPTAPR